MSYTMSVCSSLIPNWSVPLLHSWVRLSAGSSDTPVHKQLHGWGGGPETSHPSLHSSYPDAPHATRVQVTLIKHLWFNILILAPKINFQIEKLISFYLFSVFPTYLLISPPLCFSVGAALTCRTPSLKEVTLLSPGRTWRPIPAISLAWTHQTCKGAWVPMNPTRTPLVTCGKVGTLNRQELNGSWYPRRLKYFLNYPFSQLILNGL